MTFVIPFVKESVVMNKRVYSILVWWPRSVKLLVRVQCYSGHCDILNVDMNCIHSIYDESYHVWGYTNVNTNSMNLKDISWISWETQLWYLIIPQAFITHHSGELFFCVSLWLPINTKHQTVLSCLSILYSAIRT